MIEAGQTYLEPVWHNAHWQLFKVVGSPGLTTGPARLVSLHPDEVVVDAAGRGHHDAAGALHTGVQRRVGSRVCRSVEGTVDGGHLARLRAAS